MPARPKNPLRNKVARAQRRVPVHAPTNIELRSGEVPVARREPVVALTRAEPTRSRGVDAVEKAIAKEDARIIARASASALRRGLH